MVCAFTSTFAMGSGPVTWLYMAEVLSLDVIGVGQGLGTAANWCMVILISGLFPLLKLIIKVGLGARGGDYCG